MIKSKKKLKPKMGLALPVLFPTAEHTRNDVLSPMCGTTFAAKLFYSAYWLERIRIEGYEPFEIEGG